MAVSTAPMSPSITSAVSGDTNKKRANVLVPPSGCPLPRYLRKIYQDRVRSLVNTYDRYDGRPPAAVVIDDLSFTREKYLPYLEHDVAKVITSKLADYGRIKDALRALASPQNMLPRDVATKAAQLYKDFEAKAWDGTRKKTRPTAALTGELPPTDHPIWGKQGIMHGIMMRHGTNDRILYDFDPRYADEARDAHVFGHNGLRPGAWFAMQKAAIFRGAHSQPIRGISGDDAGQGAYSVVVSDEYEDVDEDHGDVVYYSGEGAITKESGRKMDAKGNQALLASLRTRRPVRVLRSAKGAPRRTFAPPVGIRYDGLYLVEGVEQRRNRQGGSYQRFKLVRMAGQPSLDSIMEASPSAKEVEDYWKIRAGY